MWISFEREAKKLAWIQDRDTIGSARSNALVLEGKDIRPLHGQFRVEDSKLFFRDFLGAKTMSFQNSQMQIASWRLELLSKNLDDEEVFSFLQTEFQDFVRNQVGASLNQTELRRKFLGHRLINSNTPQLADEWIHQMQNEVALDSPVESLLKDESISDVLINSWDQIFAEKSGVLSKTRYRFTSQESYEIYVQNLLTKHNCQHSPRRAFHNFQTSDGVRVHVIGPPLTPENFFISFRRFPKKNWALADFLARGFLSESEATFLRRAVQEKQNLIISGATGSGKTSLLKALLQEISAEERIIVLEDTPEIFLDRNNALFLRCREDSLLESESVGLRQLLKESLRMRPDRIILGEVRGEEAFYLLMAMNTGHRGSICSLHANSPREALWRLQSLVQLHKNSLSEAAVRDLCARNVGVLVHLEKVGAKRKIQKIQCVRGIEGQNFLLEDVCA